VPFFAGFVHHYYILNLSASIVASAAIMGILVSYDLSALNECRLLIGNIIMAYYSCDFNIGFNAISFRQYRWTYLSLAGAFLVFFYSIIAKGIDLSEIVTGVITFFTFI
jgi:hypothetical protein